MFVDNAGIEIDANLGEAISRETVRLYYLIPLFKEVLKHHPNISNIPEIPNEATESPEHEWWYKSTAINMEFDLLDMLKKSAPDGYYFGVNELDDSYGYWED